MDMYHQSIPIRVSDSNRILYKLKYNRDLRVELNLDSYGLSTTMCMCPKCPSYGKHLPPRLLTPDGAALPPDLSEHKYEIHRTMLQTMTENPTCSNEQLLVKFTHTAAFHNHPANFTALKAKFEAFRHPLAWDTFEKMINELLNNPQPIEE